MWHNIVSAAWALWRSPPPLSGSGEGAPPVRRRSLASGPAARPRPVFLTQEGANSPQCRAICCSPASARATGIPASAHPLRHTGGTSGARHKMQLDGHGRVHPPGPAAVRAGLPEHHQPNAKRRVAAKQNGTGR